MNINSIKLGQRYIFVNPMKIGNSSVTAYGIDVESKHQTTSTRLNPERNVSGIYVTADGMGNVDTPRIDVKYIESLWTEQTFEEQARREAQQERLDANRNLASQCRAMLRQRGMQFNSYEMDHTTFNFNGEDELRFLLNMLNQTNIKMSYKDNNIR